ncbi:MAG: phospho-sugar mutase [Spirochaetia bacterium]|nr:phospho-sugar mutase [Spirochaetia bacterium]MCF7946626.1 phospho-sugar mutase [Spirochaetia bacterium]MCF7952702.1 phospho-sugar mutase [Spirochaetales bacterium]
MSNNLEKLANRASYYISMEHNDWFKNDVMTVINKDDADGLNDRFYTTLAFGTAGMRGIIGGGTNRINPYMIRRITQGLANYINEFTGNNENDGESGSVAAAFDSRNYSDVFAQEAAQVLCANGIHVHLYPELRPVPMLSFAVRKLGATAGITITASHNPAEYNGYKVYWSDGGQVTPPHDDGIVEKVSILDDSEIRVMDLKEAAKKGLFSYIKEDIDEAYFTMVKNLSLRPELFDTYAETVKIVYTPLHGSGLMPVERIFSDMGIELEIVAQQKEPDGNFPTVENPNPEDGQAMHLALELAREKKADIVMGTDPDSDRLGIAVPVNKSKENYTLLTGNQIAALLCDYLYRSSKEKGLLDSSCRTLKSIVTTELVKKITESYGGQCEDVLTGFKYIAEKMRAYENTGETYIFGAEESYGYLAERDVRDKDAVSAAFLAAEMTFYYTSLGISLLDRLEQLWNTFGYHEEKTLSYKFPGQSGQDIIKGIMKEFRDSVSDTIAGDPITEKTDLLKGDNNFPEADVLIYRLEGGKSFILRPSGTEPKIKCYIFAVSEEDNLESSKKAASETITAYTAFFEDIIASVKQRSE